MNQKKICNEALRIMGVDTAKHPDVTVGYRFLRIYTVSDRPRKHVDSKVVEPKQIEGEK